MNILSLLRERAKEYDCSVCGQNHSRSDIRVLGRQQERTWLVKVTCSKCATSFKLYVVLTDDPAGAPKKRDHPSGAHRRRVPLTLDEVLDAHEFLRAYEGGIDGLFAPPPKERVAGRSARRT